MVAKRSVRDRYIGVLAAPKALRADPVPIAAIPAFTCLRVRDPDVLHAKPNVILDLFGNPIVPIFRGQDLDRNQLGRVKTCSIGIWREKTLTSGRRILVTSMRVRCSCIARILHSFSCK
jgi:hypothetical protein